LEALNAKLREEIMTAVEHAELLRLIDRVEQLNVERLEKLIQLAEIRQVSVREIMQQLGIERPAYG
jgi:hypothetical protein